ncbi:9038_t:CDS:2, partial [Paraglomus occultum]
LIYDILNNAAGVSKGSKEKQLIVIHGLLSGQKIVDGRPRQIRTNSHYELKGEKALANQSETNKCERSTSMWRELVNNTTKQINFVEYKSILGSKCKVRGRTKRKRLSNAEMTNAIARTSVQEREKELLSQFAVVLNERKEIQETAQITGKSRNSSHFSPRYLFEAVFLIRSSALMVLQNHSGISTEDITVPSSIVNEEMSEEPKTTKRKAAPK